MLHVLQCFITLVLLKKEGEGGNGAMVPKIFGIDHNIKVIFECDSNKASISEKCNQQK